MLRETPSFFQKILLSDEWDIFSNMCGKLYITKPNEEDLELDYDPTLNRDNRTVKVWLLLVLILSGL